MRKCMFLILLMAISMSGSVWADSFPLTYTATGTGGLSQPVAGISNSSFWWANNSGTIPGSVLSSYGFSLLTDPSRNDQFSGSLLLSSSFTLNDGDTLNVAATALQADFFAWPSDTFGVLLQGSQVDAVLFNVRPDGIPCVDGAYGCGPTPGNTAPSPGVTTSTTRSSLTNIAVVGGVDYGAVTDASRCGYNCQLNIASSYAPGAGTYQLLFGSVYWSGAYGWGDYHPTAVVVENVSVPEPSSWEFLLCMGLLLATLLNSPRVRSRFSSAI